MRYSIRIGFWLLGVICWCGEPSLSFSPEALAMDLTLPQCINLAIAHDPETQNARQRMEIGKLKRDKAVQEFLPKIDIYQTYSPQTDYYGRPVTSQNVFYTGVGLEQPLYKGGNLVKGVKLSESETRLYEFGYLDRKLKVASEATKSYYQSLTAHAVVQQYEALLRFGEEDLREAQVRWKSGTGTQLEILDLTVKLLETQQKLSKAKTNQQLELSQLKVLTGLEEGASLSLVSHFPLKDIRNDFEGLLKEAQTARLDLKAGEEDVTFNQLKTDIERGKQLPQLSLVARYELEDPTLLAGRKDWLVMLKASISFWNSTLSYADQRQKLYDNPYAFPTPPGFPGQNYNYSMRQWKLSIFDKSSNKVDLEEARAARNFSHDRWSKLKRQVLHDVHDAHAQKKDSVSRMATAKKQISAAQELLEVTRTRYTAGYATLADIFKARASLAEAQVNLETARNDQAIALGKLYWALSRELTFQGSGL